MKEYWTIVFTEHPENELPGYPVKPWDDNDHDDEGMLAYYSREAAEAAARFQLDNWEIHCEAVPLGSELQGIRVHIYVAEMLSVIKQAIYVWQSIGFHEFSGTASRCFKRMVEIVNKANGENSK